MKPCPLCHSEAAPIPPVWERPLFDCPECGLVFVDPAAHLSHEDEHARYATHENHPEDQGYRDFLDRLAQPLVERLLPGTHGLDFGSGPGPVLAAMLTERGFPTTPWDPYFAPDSAAMAREWAFISCTEVVEHLSDPARSWALLDRLLAPGGLLGVMTTVLTDDVDLDTWWYLRDPTHVVFYRPATLTWIARRFSWEIERLDGEPNVTFFRKPMGLKEV